MQSFKRFRLHNDVIHEGQHSLVEDISEDVVDHTLECRRYITNSK